MLRIRLLLRNRELLEGWRCGWVEGWRHGLNIEVTLSSVVIRSSFACSGDTMGTG